MNKPKVTRYGILDPYYPTIGELKGGKYVKFKDYRELETEIVELRAENAELKRRISGHIGAVDIFCERNDNLLAENAILREGLTKVGYALQSTDSTKMYAREVLTAADKVKDGHSEIKY